MRLVLRFAFIGVCVALCSASVAWAQGIVHQADWIAIRTDAAAPPQLIRPEGTTRWDLTGFPQGVRFSRTLHRGADGALALTDGPLADGAPAPRVAGKYRDSTGGFAVSRWLQPHLVTATGDSFEMVREIGGVSERWRVRIELVGHGRVELPARGRDARLERVLIVRTDDRGAELGRTLMHRWVDPRGGVIAEAWGPAAPGGRTRVELEGAAVVEQVVLGGLPLEISADEVGIPVFGRVTYGWDRERFCLDGTTPCSSDDDCNAPADLCGDSIDTVTPGTQATAWEVVCDPATPGGSDCQAVTWDFSGNNDTSFPGSIEFATTRSPINSSETCNFDECGFTEPGAELGREDKDWNNPGSHIPTVTAQVTEERLPDDITFWFRGGSRQEGIAGGLGAGESRFCYIGDDGGAARTEVPLWQFQHCTGSVCTMKLGDVWLAEDPATGLPRTFQCEASIFPGVCGTCGFLNCPVRLSGGICDGETFAGQQSVEIFNEGLATMPSGHVFDVLVAESRADFCISSQLLDPNCNNPIDNARTTNYLFVAPNLGTVVRLQSQKTAQSVDVDLTGHRGWNHLAEMDVKFGLFPPRSIGSTGETDTTIDISWDPGLDTHRIDGYRVYWDTDSGDPSPYAFDSVNNPGQVNIVGTSATISGLTAATDYFITVTAVHDFTNPATLATTTYESLLFPKQVSGYPGEVMATTTGGLCTPTQEITGVTVTKAAGSSCEVCWDASADPCVDGYSILGAGSPESDTNFTTLVPDSGLVTCHTFSTNETYLIVVGKGTGGTGPWGHYGN